ncbi:hypothetical protein ACI65C_013228, partial [Semiaphis heraclei]
MPFIPDDRDIESLFSIKCDEDLLISKISLFVGKKHIRNSARRIMGRMMFDGSFLVNYSLYGVKQKKTFSNLARYRLII